MRLSIPKHRPWLNLRLLPLAGLFAWATIVVPLTHPAMACSFVSLSSHGDFSRGFGGGIDAIALGSVGTTSDAGRQAWIDVERYVMGEGADGITLVSDLLGGCRESAAQLPERATVVLFLSGVPSDSGYSFHTPWPGDVYVVTDGSVTYVDQQTHITKIEPVEQFLQRITNAIESSQHAAGRSVSDTTEQPQDETIPTPPSRLAGSPISSNAMLSVGLGLSAAIMAGIIVVHARRRTAPHRRVKP